MREIVSDRLFATHPDGALARLAAPLFFSQQIASAAGSLLRRLRQHHWHRSSAIANRALPTAARPDVRCARSFPVRAPSNELLGLPSIRSRRREGSQKSSLAALSACPSEV